VVLINTDGMALIGPGSEWLWTAVSGLVLAATFIAIYRQLRAQGAANAVHRMEVLQGQWDSERMTHARLVVVLWRKHAADPSPDFRTQAALYWVCSFFENLSDLEEDGHLTWKEVENSWGEVLVGYWALLAPSLLELRGGSSTVFTGFERLAGQAEVMARRRGEDWSVSEAEIPAYLETQIGRNTAKLIFLRDIAAGVIPSDPLPEVKSAPVPA
jgi:hypothetical protein